MNVSEAQARVREVIRVSRDIERAHALEDSLLEDFIRDTAAGSPARRAAQVIRDELLDTERKRWYA